MLMQRIMSAPASPANAAARAGSVPGLKATPTARPESARGGRDPARIVGRLDVEGDGVGAGLGELGEVMGRVADHQVTVEHAAGSMDHRRDRAQHDRPDRHRRDEMPVADVEVEDAAARSEQRRRSARRGG